MIFFDNKLLFVGGYMKVIGTIWTCERYRWAAMFLSCFYVSVLWGQGLVEKKYSKEYTILYKISNSRVDSLFADNRLRLKALENGFRNLLSIEDVKIDSLCILSSASPDGDSLYNYRLSVERGKSLHEYLLRIFPDFKNRMIVQVPVGENWVALKEIAEQDTDIPSRQELLDIINGSQSQGEKERRLKQNRTLYRYILKKHIPKLRSAQVLFNYSRKEFCFSQAEPRPLALPPDMPARLSVYSQPAERKKRGFVFPHFAVRTNLLYDAAMTPNIGLEFFFHDKWSVAANWMYAWWKSDRKSFYWRVYGGDVEGRWWLGKNGYGDKYTGHHLGVYVQAGTFDFELGKKGQVVDDWSFGGGVAYGYAMPIARRLNLDFSIGLGYFRGDFKEYQPIDEHYVWQRTKRRNWIGPTKAEITLVWHIGGKKR